MKEEEIKDEVDEFTGTAVRLMRLTRENKIEWQREGTSLATEFGGFRFRLEEVRRQSDQVGSVIGGFSSIDRAYMSMGIALPKDYRLVVFDEESEEELVSPPMKAARDLAAIVEKRFAAEARKIKEMKFSDVNRRLDETLEP